MSHPHDSANTTDTDKHSSCCNDVNCSGNKTVVRDFPKVGRNEPCPCGSERKFKKCCGKAA